VRRKTVANATTRSRGAGSPARRTLTAAARAAAQRAQRPAPEADREGPRKAGDEAHASGPTLLIDPPKNGWEDPPEPSPESPEEEETRERAPAWRPGQRPLLAVLCALLAAGLVAVGVLGWQYREGRQTEAARDQALAAAREAAPVVLSYDYRHLDRDFARARERLTGKFREQYVKTTRTVVGPTATKYHGVVKATVATASVASAGPDRVVALLFVNQVTQSTQVSGSRLDLNRVRMTLSRTSAGWKVSAVDAL
jgi:Mce-associated membrane protein